MTTIDFSSLRVESEPFPHFYLSSVFSKKLEAALLDWFESTDEWELTVTDFYEQFEFSFFDVQLPDHLKSLVSQEVIDEIEIRIKETFNSNSVELVGITAHKLTEGQRIGIHNDFIDGEETHRLLIQINSGWTDDNGGFLMLFNSFNVRDIAKIIRPISNSGLGFEISGQSYHAVSATNNISRYTIVYTFKEKDDEPNR